MYITAYAVTIFAFCEKHAFAEDPGQIPTRGGWLLELRRVREDVIQRAGIQGPQAVELRSFRVQRVSRTTAREARTPKKPRYMMVDPYSATHRS